MDPSSTIHVLSIEDDVDYERLIGAWLNQAKPVHFQVTPAERLSDVACHFELEGYDCMLLDLGLSDSLGLETLALAREIATDLPIVVLTAADDYLVKGSFGPEALIATIVAAIGSRRDGFGLDNRCLGMRSPHNFGISMSVRIAGDLPAQLGAPSPLIDRYRRASTLRF